MSIETEHQFLRRVRKLPPEKALEAIEERWSALYKSDTIWHDDEAVNEAINRLIAYRKKQRFKTPPEWIAGTLQKMQHLSSEHIVESINHNIANAYQGFFIPSHLKHQNNEQLNQDKPKSAAELFERSKQRYDYS